MPNNDLRKPEYSESASLADAGGEQQQPNGRRIGRAAAPTATDYDAREEGISEERKAMGPPLQEAATTALDDSQAREDYADEAPVDPA